MIQKAITRARLAGGDEVIVVDGGSDDDTVKIAESCGAFVYHDVSGRGNQLNRGAEKASGDLLLFLHADNWLGESVCGQLRTCPHATNEIWGCFRQKIGDQRALYRWLAKGNEWRVRWQGLVYGDQAMFVNRYLFHSIGGFPNQPLMEDFEISRRLYRKSRPILLDGPTYVSDRRWQRRGVIRQTLTNWSLATRYRMGESPANLANRYRRHDQAED